MKNLVVILCVLLLAASCGNKTEVPINNGNNDPQSDIEATILVKTLKSKLKYNHKLELGKVYLDTVIFLEHDNNGDYGMFNVKKGLDTIILAYNGESNFIRGEQLQITWKMDSIWNSGDGEMLEITEWLLEAKKLNSLKLSNKKVRFLWRETDSGDHLNKIKLNTDYLKSVSEPEKAVLAYVACFVGNECEWDGERNEKANNLNCKIISSLNLGYQCSDKHLDYIRRWFKNDLNVLKDLENCSITPDGATVQSTFKEINVEVNEQKIIVLFKATGLNLKEQKTWTWTEKLFFKFSNNELKLLKKEVLDH